MFSKSIYINYACFFWSRCNLQILCCKDYTTGSITFLQARKYTVNQNTITILMKYSKNVETLNVMKQLTDYECLSVCFI